MITIDGEDYKITILTTMMSDGVICHGSRIPWGWGPSSKPYHDLTEGNIVVMGRRTFESLPRPFLSNRLLIVLSESLLNDMHPDASDASAYVLVANAHHSVILASDFYLVLHDLKYMSDCPNANHAHLFQSVTPLMNHEISSLRKYSECRNIYVVGEEKTFSVFMGEADEVISTELHQDYSGDAYFPTLNDPSMKQSHLAGKVETKWGRKQTG